MQGALVRGGVHDLGADVVVGPGQGFGERRVLLDELQTDVLRWKFTAGWICKWEGPAFNAMQSEIAIEAIEICLEKFEMV